MQLTTTEKVLICTDREGEQWEHLRININVGKKDDVLKRYPLHTFDSIVLNEGTDFESTTPKLNRYGQPQEKEYFKTYDEYDSQKAQLLEMFSDEIEEFELKGSELDDFLLKKGLWLSLQSDPVYVDGSKWK